MTDARDRRLLYAAAFVRAMATSTTGVLAGVYLGKLGLDADAAGVIIASGFAGATVAAVLATFTADRIGRRRFLVVVGLVGTIGAVVFALAQSPYVLAAAAFVGMINGMGRDRGAALILEQAALPGTTTAEARTRVIAGYTMLQDIGHALGALLAGVPAWIGSSGSEGSAAAHRTTLLVCASCGLVVVALYLAMGKTIESAPGTRRPAGGLSARSRAILVRISALFALDSIAGGFLTTALLSYFFFERFGVDETAVAGLFFGARLLNAVSHLGAAWLARRIGLVRTMVLTHIPSSLLLVTVAFAPSFPIAAALFLLREGLVEMDVPTRQSYVLAVVEPGERTMASGVTNLVRLGGWAVAPAVAGSLMARNALYAPLVLGAAMKIAYDLLLWRAFRRVQPPEEQRD